MTELIWDGKYKDDKKQGPVRIALPFQTIETVNESVQDRQRSLELYAAGRETEWRNRLIWGDKKYVLPSLLPEFAGKVNLIYIDPPFDTGADFSFTATIPDHPDTPEDETTAFTKEPSILEQKAYRDTWGRGLDSYLQWFYECAVVLNELLHENGSLYVHFDWHVGHYSKSVLDEVFGQDRFVNEIIWKRTSARSGSTKWGNIHDTILLYAKSEEPIWNPVYQTYDAQYLESKYKYSDNKGVYRLDNLTAPGITAGESSKPWRAHDPAKLGRHWAVPVEALQSALGDRDASRLTSAQKLEILWESGFIQLPQKADGGGFPQFKRYLGKGTPIQDVITDLSPVNSQALERLGYDTQKPEALLERIIKASSNEGDLVLDCFVGSGTTAAVAEKLNRRWIACDLGRFAIHTTRKRLLGIPGVKPFAVQNLGKYERQAWQAAEFDVGAGLALPEGAASSAPTRELVYRKFILDLYHATPVSGYGWLHGTKAGRMVHVGAVDAPVTLADVKAIAKEVWKAAGNVGAIHESPLRAAVDILGWEFALEVNETAKQVAAESRVNVTFKKIPHEALDKKAVEQGDIKFFELGALSVDVGAIHELPLRVTLRLTDFVIPIDDIPVEVRKAIKHWSQLVDYWAVDWDYKGDTFHNQWQSYRTRKDPKIELETTHTYAEPGKYAIVVKVIDILGNDTTKTMDVKV